jgi:hypothetical protein
LLNDYYSSISIPDDIEGEFSTLIFKSPNEKVTHLISFSSSSSKSLAKFKESLSGSEWDLYAAELNKNMESEYAIAGNNTNFSDIPNDDLPEHTIFQAWTYKVKDVTNFNNAFKKLVNTPKPNGYIGMGDIVHGSDGANVWIFKTHADVSEAFEFGTKNDLEKTAYSLFYKKISEETLNQSFTRKLITRFT